MKVYTKTGDTGTTALFGGTRVPKDHARIESYGTVDELNSYIGLIRDQEINQHFKDILIEIQDRLFTVGAILATPPEKEVLKNGQKRLQNLGIIESDIELLEKEIDTIEDSLPQMTHFILNILVDSIVQQIHYVVVNHLQNSIYLHAFLWRF